MGLAGEQGNKECAVNSATQELSRQFIAGRHDLMAFIFGLVRDPQVAEDMFQEVWIRLAQASDKGTEIRDLPKWSRGVARNLILHHWRRERGRKVVADSRIVELAERAFEEREAAGQDLSRKRALVDCVKGLPEKSRSLLELKYDEGLPGSEVATRLGSTYDAVMRTLSRVRQALARCVEKKLALAQE
jgi:RNA polymerase sigma-70 factor (ECF subfamily)